MAKYIALLRAVNVGGTGKLPIAELRAMCISAGFSRVQTYIASGNIVFESKLSSHKVKSELEARLFAYAGIAVGGAVRTASEMAAVLKAKPFPKITPNQSVAIFLDVPPSLDVVAHVPGVQDEEMRFGAREVYVQYGAGTGRSKMKIPADRAGTMRNMNTIAKLVELAARL